MSDNKPAKIENILQSNKIRLTAPCPTARGKMSTFSWDIWSNNPRFILNVNDPALANPDMGYGRVQGAIEPPTFYAFLQHLDTAIAATGEWKVKIAILGNAKGGQMGDPPVGLSDLWVGKDKEGLVYVSLISKKEGFPIIKFVFNAPDSRYAKHWEQTGTELDKAAMSVLYAKSYREMLGVMMAAVLTKEYVKPPPYIPANKSGGYNRPQSQSNSGANISDDELPF